MHNEAVDQNRLGGREAGHATAHLNFPDSRAPGLSGRRPIDRYRPPARDPGVGRVIPVSPVLRAAARARPRGPERPVVRPAHGAGVAGTRRYSGDRESTGQTGPRRDRRRFTVPALYRRRARAWLPDGRKRHAGAAINCVAINGAAPDIGATDTYPSDT